MGLLKKLRKKFCKPAKLREKEDLTDEEIDIRWNMYKEYRTDLLSRQLSNQQNYDKAIMTLSSAGFAISVTAVQFMITQNQSVDYHLIIYSWWLFFSTIVNSLLAYVVSNAAINKEIDNARDYYIEHYVDALSNRTVLSKINEILNLSSGITFLLAIFFTIKFFTQMLQGA